MYTKPQVRKGLLGRMLVELLDTRVMVKQAMKAVKSDRACLMATWLRSALTWNVGRLCLASLMHDNWLWSILPMSRTDIRARLIQAVCQLSRLQIVLCRLVEKFWNKWAANSSGSIHWQADLQAIDIINNNEKWGSKVRLQRFDGTALIVMLGRIRWYR